MDDPAIDCLKDLGKGSIHPELINAELPSLLKALENFVCCVYSSKGPTTLPSLRWELFQSKNLEGEVLPPTHAALLPHILHSNYVTMRDKSYKTNCPELLPPIEQNGWSSESGGYVPVRCLALPAPLELIKCGCKVDCKGLARDSAAAQRITCLAFLSANVMVETVQTQQVRTFQKMTMMMNRSSSII